MKKFEILETTLRDGSYAVNFSFTVEQTSKICKLLQNAGFKYIEIGHGLGLNASDSGFGKAKQTDEEYLKAATSVLDKSKFGMFCIPGIARLQDIDLAALYGMSFIRIGTNVTELESAEKFILKAKKHGMFVAANLMKSYAVSPEELSRRVKMAEDFGADVVYIVDSAGSMLPEDIKNYYQEIRKISNISLGFHGHDNLSLAVANSLCAINLGFDFVDSSLQGLGRSAGNASTESLVAALIKAGEDLGINLIQTLKIGQDYIRPLIKTVGQDLIGVISGFAEFHSSFMKYINQSSLKYNIDPVGLIIEVSKVEKVNVTDQLVNKIALETKNKKTSKPKNLI
ncbi:4-hydroxy-2-oxovalerate aldolase [Candidatus Dependentiae bacterium]